MSWSPAGRALWDPWVVDTGDAYWMYHLSAPAGLDKKARDDEAEIWLAESDDLRAWRSRGPVLRPGPAGSDDDLACWTGHTVRSNAEWLTFYTGRNHREGDTQHVFVARSGDGIRWRATHEALLRCPDDHPIYLATHPRVFPAWRDPFYLHADGRHLLLITALARATGAPGCLALAEADGPTGPYRLREPLLPPGTYDQIEVPQLIFRHGWWVLLFSTAASDYDPQWADRVGAQTGLHAWVAETVLGPYHPLGGTGHVPGFGTSSGLYSVRVTPDRHDAAIDWAVGWYWAPECFEPGGSRASIVPDARALTVCVPHSLRFEDLLPPQ